jgi:hypothetical protein
VSETLLKISHSLGRYPCGRRVLSVISSTVIMLLYITNRVTLSMALQRNKLTSVVWWSEFLAIDPEVPRSIPGATRSSEK